MKNIIIIFDWKRTLYAPDERQLISGAYELLQHLQKIGVELYIVGKGKEDMYEATKKLEVASFFKDILFVGDKKTKENFSGYMSQNEPKETIVIGDRVSSEIRLGNQLGATTIWVRQGKFSDELPANEIEQPDSMVSNLGELKTYLENYLNQSSE